MKKTKQDIPSPESTPADTSPAKEDLQQETPEEQEVTPEEKIEQLALELEEQKKETLRIFADSENLKKRLLREKNEFCQFATGTIIESILPVMDNLELALQHGKEEQGCQNLVIGVEMTLNIFRDTLQKHGLTIIGPDDLGKPFDPAVHEAMAQTPDATMDEGCVSQVMQAGYKLHDRLLRPAKVLVSSKCTPEGN